MGLLEFYPVLKGKAQVQSGDQVSKENDHRGAAEVGVRRPRRLPLLAREELRQQRLRRQQPERKRRGPRVRALQHAPRLRVQQHEASLPAQKEEEERRPHELRVRLPYRLAERQRVRRVASVPEPDLPSRVRSRETHR